MLWDVTAVRSFGTSSNAVTAIQDRARLNAETEEAIRTFIVGPVVIESVQIENIDFSDAYEQSIENRMLAEVEVQKLQQNAEREKVQAQITVTQANARADAIRAEWSHIDGVRSREKIAALIQQGLDLAPRLSLRAADPRASAFWEANGFTPDTSGTRRSHLLTR